MKLDISLREAEILRIHLEDFLQDFVLDGEKQVVAALKKILRQVSKALDVKPEA